MIPILLISKNKKKRDSYIAAYKKEHLFSQFMIFAYERIEKSGITIDQLREISTLTKQSSSQRQLFIIYDFHTAKIEAQNVLLKTLEESQNSHFILTSFDENSVLETIRSRCVVTKLIDASVLKLENPFISDSIYELFSQHTLSTSPKEKSLAILYQVLQHVREAMKISYSNPSKSTQLTILIKEIVKVTVLIEKNNINPQLALDHIFLECARQNLLDNLVVKR